VKISAFIARVPEAESCVRELRLRYDESAQLGVPAHITLLFPFMGADLISTHVLERAANALRAVPSFTFQLAQVRRFSGVSYLAPEPASPFVALTSALQSEFPEHPLYGGQHSRIIPHLTVAKGTDEEVEHASGQLSRWLSEKGSIRARCSSVALIENSQGYWKEMHEFDLPGAEG